MLKWVLLRKSHCSGTFESPPSQSCRCRNPIPEGEARIGATDGRDAGSLEASGTHIVWEVVIFNFLFCFKEKHLTKKENFLNENIIAWSQWRNLQLLQRWGESPSSLWGPVASGPACECCIGLRVSPSGPAARGALTAVQTDVSLAESQLSVAVVLTFTVSLPFLC